MVTVPGWVLVPRYIYPSHPIPIASTNQSMNRPSKHGLEIFHGSNVYLWRPYHLPVQNASGKSNVFHLSLGSQKKMSDNPGSPLNGDISTSIWRNEDKSDWRLWDTQKHVMESYQEYQQRRQCIDGASPRLRRPIAHPPVLNQTVSIHLKHLKSNRKSSPNDTKCMSLYSGEKWKQRNISIHQFFWQQRRGAPLPSGVWPSYPKGVEISKMEKKIYKCGRSWRNNQSTNQVSLRWTKYMFVW